EWWGKKLGTKVLAYLKASDVAMCRDELARTKSVNGSLYKSASVNHYLLAFSHVCNIAYREWEWLTENPVAKVRKMKLPRGRTRYLSDDERERLVKAWKASQSKLLYPIVVVALSTGMRSGEITSLAWKNVDLQRGRVILERTKNGEARSVPITGHA